MGFTLEVIYAAPIDRDKEREIHAIAASLAGELEGREEESPLGPRAVVLTYHFDDYRAAYEAAAKLRAARYRVEGPREEEG